MTKRSLSVLFVGLATVGALTACSGNDSKGSSTASTSSTTSTSASASAANGPSATLAATPWLTTAAKDAHGTPVALTDDSVKSYVGYAYFKADGTFTMFNLDDSPKMHGDWTVTADGKKRTIVAKDDAGKEKFRRDVEIVTLTNKEFTYRVVPDAANPAVYFDIVHTPTDHKAPTHH